VGGTEGSAPAVRFHRLDKGSLFFAGLYEPSQPSPDTWQRTFTIIPTSPNDLVAQVHDRMPAIIGSDHADDWLFQGNESPAVKSPLEAVPSDYLVAAAVSRVNSVQNDDAACLEAVPYPLSGASVATAPDSPGREEDDPA